LVTAAPNGRWRNKKGACHARRDLGLNHLFGRNVVLVT
jgi:hypothetical protein